MKTVSTASLAAWGSYTLGVSVGSSDLTQPAVIASGVLTVLFVAIASYLIED